jgi:stage V sporulation protein G
MEITGVNVRLIKPVRRSNVLCVASVTLDNCFVVRNIRLLEGPKGYFIAMPSQALTTKCRRCGRRNPVRSNYCNLCGSRLPEERLPIDQQTGKPRAHQDVAHPIKTELREKIQASIIQEYKKVLEQYQSQSQQRPTQEPKREDYSAGQEKFQSK